MQSLEEFRFASDEGWQFPEVCEADDEFMDECSCDGCTQFPDVDHEERQELVEDSVGLNAEPVVEGLIATLPNLKLIEWWFYDADQGWKSSSMFWEWMISRAEGKEPRIDR